MSSTQSIPGGAPARRKGLGGCGCVLLSLGAIVVVGMIAVFGYVAYLVHHAATPEGIAEAQKDKVRQQAAVSDFRAKVDRIRNALPARGAADVACPAGTRAVVAPWVDTYFLGAIATPAGAERDDDLLRSGVLRDKIGFPDGMVEAVSPAPRHTGEHADGDNAVADLSATWGIASIESLADDATVVVLRVDDMTLPSLSKGGRFEPGSLSGDAAVFDWQKDLVLCHASFDAKSSSSIRYGGGVQLKVGGIPLPTVGSDDAKDAIRSDLQDHAKTSIRAALRRIGAS